MWCKCLKILELRNLPYAKLLTLQSELGSLIQAYNESLVQELALKDELEYEKELKNSFISLLLNIQNKRRQYIMEKKKKMANAQPQSQTVSNGNGDVNAPQVSDMKLYFLILQILLFLILQIFQTWLSVRDRGDSFWNWRSPTRQPNAASSYKK